MFPRSESGSSFKRWICTALFVSDEPLNKSFITIIILKTSAQFSFVLYPLFFLSLCLHSSFPIKVSLQWPERITVWMLPRPATWMTRVRSTAHPTSVPAPAASPLLKSATRGSATRPCGSSLTRQGTSDTSLYKKKETKKHTHCRFSKRLISDKSWMSTTKDLLQKEEWFWSG